MGWWIGIWSSVSLDLEWGCWIWDRDMDSWFLGLDMGSWFLDLGMDCWTRWNLDLSIMDFGLFVGIWDGFGLGLLDLWS